MSNFVIPFSCVALLGAAVFYAGAQKNQSTLIEIVPSSKEEKVAKTYKKQNDAKIWVLTDVDTRQFCLLYKTRAINAQEEQLDVDPACNGIFHGSDLANSWINEEGGRVSIADRKGQSLVRFQFSEREGLRSVPSYSGNLLLVPNS